MSVVLCTRHPPQYNKSEAHQTYKNVTQKYRFQFKVAHLKNLINTLTNQFNLERLHPKSIKSDPKFFNFLIIVPSYWMATFTGNWGFAFEVLQYFMGYFI